METFKWCKPASTSAGTAAASVEERLRVEQKWLPGLAGGAGGGGGGVPVGWDQRSVVVGRP